VGRRLNHARDEVAGVLLSLVTGLIASPAYRIQYRDVMVRGLASRDAALDALSSPPSPNPDWNRK